MARKGLAGQLNMFDLFKSMEDIPMGEVQMVSLMPEDEDEPQVEEIPQVVDTPQVEETAPVVEAEESKVEIQVQKIEKTAVKKETTPRKKAKKTVEMIPEKVEPVPEPEPVKEESDEESFRPTVKVQRITSSGNDKPAMCRQYVIDGKQLEIAYINYNKVRITREGQEPELYEFDSSKDAVDYYVQRMQELEPDEE